MGGGEDVRSGDGKDEGETEVRVPVHSAVDMSRVRLAAPLVTETSCSSSLPLARSLGQPDLTSNATSPPFTATDFGFHVAPVLGFLLFPISGNCTILVSAFFSL